MVGNPIWSLPIAWSVQLAVDVTGGLIFNGFNLSDCWEFSRDTSNYDDMNKIDIDTYDAPRTDWGWVLGYYVRGKSMNFKIIIMKDTETELNDAIDDLKLKLFKKEWILKIKVNGVYRQVKASLTSLNFNRDFESSTILTDVSLSFISMDNLADVNATSATETSVNTPTLSLDINNTWARTDYSLYFIFWVWTTTTEITIEQDGYTLTIPQAINPWDILVVDWVNKQVLYNGTAIDYDWPFVQIENGSNPVLISINWTYIADITYLYYVNYL